MAACPPQDLIDLKCLMKMSECCSVGIAQLSGQRIQSFYKTPGSSRAFILIRKASDSYSAPLPQDKDNNSTSKNNWMTHKDKEHKQLAADEPV